MSQDQQTADSTPPTTTADSILKEEIASLSSLENQQELNDKIDQIKEQISNTIFPPEKQSTLWSSLGEALYQLERDDQAMSMIEKAIQLDDQNSRSFFFKGLISAVIPGRQDDDIPSFEKAIELKPTIGYYWWELGRAFLRKQLDEKALASLKKYVEIDREDAIRRDVLSSFYNMGVRWFLKANYEMALEAFSFGDDELCEKQANIDLQLKGKIIQTLEKLGRLQERDDKIQQLYQLHNQKKSIAGGDQVRFCRDQFALDSFQGKTNVNVFVYEHFELLGEMAVKYVFQVTDDKSILCKISLGSYEFTNQIHTELNSPQQPDSRVYHLDGYYPGVHQTFGFYSGTTEKPNISYDELKQTVLQILQGNASAISSSSNSTGSSQ